MERWKWSLSTGVDSATFTWLYWRQCTASCLGGWEGGSLTAPSDVIRQMHTIGRMVVKYTRLGMVGVLLFWKYCCFICGTEKREKLHVSPGALVYSQISLSRKLKKTKAALINTSSTRCLEKIASKPRARANVLRTNILRACRFGHEACSTELRKVDHPLRCYYTNAHNRKNVGNIYSARNCGTSIVMKTLLLYFRYREC